MKRWPLVAEVSGLLIVLAFVVERFSHVPKSWLYLSDDLKPDLVSLGLGCIVIAALSLAILWGGDLLWKRIRRKQPGKKLDEPLYSTVGHWRHFIEVALVSMILGVAAEYIKGVETPGTLVRRLIFKLDVHNLVGAYFTLALYFLVPVVLDGAICFAILWCGYLLLVRVQRKPTGKNLEVGR